MKETIRTTPKKCACKMVAGEAWAVRQAGYLVGYYLACPHCGMVNIILSDEAELQEVRRAGVAVPDLVGIIPGVVCTRCRLGFRLVAGRFEEVARAGVG